MCLLPFSIVLLSGLPFCEAYLNDLEHMENLCSTFCLLKEAGLTVNLSKCKIRQATLTYLGKVLGGKSGTGFPGNHVVMASE